MTDMLQNGNNSIPSENFNYPQVTEYPHYSPNLPICETENIALTHQDGITDTPFGNNCYSRTSDQSSLAQGSDMNNSSGLQITSPSSSLCHYSSPDSSTPEYNSNYNNPNTNAYSTVARNDFVKKMTYTDQFGNAFHVDTYHTGSTMPMLEVENSSTVDRMEHLSIEGPGNADCYSQPHNQQWQK